jgi:hypothetical protein
VDDIASVNDMNSVVRNISDIAPRTFSKYLEIVSLLTTHSVLRFGLTADQYFLGSVFAEDEDKLIDNQF